MVASAADGKAVKIVVGLLLGTIFAAAKLTAVMLGTIKAVRPAKNQKS